MSLAFGASFFLEASVDSNGGDGESQRQSGIFKTQESEEQKLRRGIGGNAGGEPCPKPPLVYGLDPWLIKWRHKYLYCCTLGWNKYLKHLNCSINYCLGKVNFIRRCYSAVTATDLWFREEGRNTPSQMGSVTESLQPPALSRSLWAPSVSQLCPKADMLKNRYWSTLYFSTLTHLYTAIETSSYPFTIK